MEAQRSVYSIRDRVGTGREEAGGLNTVLLVELRSIELVASIGIGRKRRDRGNRGPFQSHFREWFFFDLENQNQRSIQLLYIGKAFPHKLREVECDTWSERFQQTSFPIFRCAFSSCLLAIKFRSLNIYHLSFWRPLFMGSFPHYYSRTQLELQRIYKKLSII